MGKPETTRRESLDPVVADEDASLMARHLDGDGQAFPLLLQAHAGSVYGYLVRSGVPPDDRDDLFQEVFLKVHRGAAGYQGCRPFKPWLFGIVVNTVRSWFRNQHADQPGNVASLEGHLQSSEPGPAAALEASETVAWLEKELAALSVPEREALILVAMERLEMNEAASVMDLPLNTVKTHLRRGRMALAQALARRKCRLDREASR